MTRIQDLEEQQGPLIRQVLAKLRVSVAGPISPGQYAKAHVAYLQTRAGAPRPHMHAGALSMTIRAGKWKAVCPECLAGVVTGRQWTEARCFGCGAVFASVDWPEQIAEVERLILKRPLRHQHWDPGETLDDIRADSAKIGIVED